MTARAVRARERSIAPAAMSKLHRFSRTQLNVREAYRLRFAV